MPIYHTLGTIPGKRHTVQRGPDGALRHEELMGNFGFRGPSSLLYHLRPPTRVREIERLRDIVLEADPTAIPHHRHFRTPELAPGGSPTLDRVPLLFAPGLTIGFARPDREDPHFYRNGIADEYVYLSAGRGRLESPFGELDLRAGDQLVIPRGILHRYRFEPEPVELLVVESRGFLRWPARYRNEFGQLVEGAPFGARDIRRPQRLVTLDRTGDHEIVVRQEHGLTRMILDHHPCDLEGWDGYYYPWAFSIHDFEPITGAIHQPPPVHQFLEGDSLVVCNFCPRPYDFHPGAIPAPYNHSNVMTDEVIYYASSEFMSRKGIGYGSITLHPDGMPHGPHPGRYEASIGKPRTDELAVMIDSFQPLAVARPAHAIEDEAYFSSWME